MRHWPVVLLLVGAVLALGPPARADDLEPGYWERTPLPQRGLATYYAQGTMDYVWNYRRERRQVPECPECVGAVALLRAGDIGRKVWLTPPSAPDQVFGPFLVVDCAHTEDIPLLLAREWVVDLSYELGQMWNMAGPVMDFIVWADPAEESTVEPTPPPTAFYIPPEDVVISAPTPDSPPSPTATLPPEPVATADTADSPPPAPRLAADAAGAPTISTPTPPGHTVAATPPVVESTQTPQPADPLASNQGPSPTPGGVALGRAGGQLLHDNVTAVPRPTLRRVTAGGSPQPTSLPILPPSGSRAPIPLPPPAEPPPLEQLWQALLRLLGR